jgi:hypothetical protein
MNLTLDRVFGRGRSLAVLLSLAVTFLTGCVGPVRVPISSDSRTQLGEVKGIVGLQQQEIGTEINASNVSAATGGGLIGAIVDASIDDARAKKAEAEVAPVRDALINYQPGSVLAADLQKALATVPSVNPSHIDVRQVIDLDTTTKWIHGAGGASVLLVRLSYKLSPNFGSIIATAEVSLHAGGDRLAKVVQSKPDLPPLVYYNVLSSTDTLFGLSDSSTLDGIAKLWAANGGRPAQTTLDAELQELAAMIAYDLMAPSPPDGKSYKAPETAELRQVPVYGMPGCPFQDGYTEHKENGRAWVRLPRGELSAIAQ